MLNIQEQKNGLKATHQNVEAQHDKDMKKK